MDRQRGLPCDDFYADWARAHFGFAAGDAIGRLMAAVDGRLPVSVAGGCPAGSLKADSKPWTEVATNYAFVAELEQLRPRVHGRGTLDRFDWWLNTFRYHRSLHQVRCTLGEFDVLMKEKQPVKNVGLCWRPLGKGEFQRIAAQQVARGVYCATLPSLSADFEYYLDGTTADDRELIWPATVPDQNQTVVVLGAGPQ